MKKIILLAFAAMALLSLNAESTSTRCNASFSEVSLGDAIKSIEQAMTTSEEKLKNMEQAVIALGTKLKNQNVLFKNAETIFLIVGAIAVIICGYYAIKSSSKKK